MTLLKPTPAKTGRKHDGRFAPGSSGNPRGKPAGARHKAIVALEKLMGGSAQEVAQAVIAAAKKGDTGAARLILDRVLPARKDLPVTIKLPDMSDAAGLGAAGAAVLAAVADGDITPGEADAMMSLIERQRRLIETVDLAERLAALESGVSR